MWNNATGLESAKPRLWKKIELNTQLFQQANISRDKSGDEGETYKLKEIKLTYQPTEMDIIWATIQANCKK